MALLPDVRNLINKMERKRAYEVSALRFLSKPFFEPYFEKLDFSQIFIVLDCDGSRYVSKRKTITK